MVSYSMSDPVKNIGVGVYDILNKDFDPQKFNPGPSNQPIVHLQTNNTDVIPKQL